MANSVDTDEVAQYESPPLDLCCFQIQLFSFFGTLSVGLENKWKSLQVIYQFFP